MRPEARGICHVCHMDNPALNATTPPSPRSTFILLFFRAALFLYSVITIDAVGWAAGRASGL